MAETVITKDNFRQEVLEAKETVLLDFWATWCGPCRMLSPIVAEIADEKAGQLKVGKVNVDDEPELATQFRINAIPMLAVMKAGKMVNSSVGYQSKEDILKML